MGLWSEAVRAGYLLRDRLARMVGKSKAIELMCSGENFSFERALELGLVNQVLGLAQQWWVIKQNEEAHSKA